VIFADELQRVMVNDRHDDQRGGRIQPVPAVRAEDDGPAHREDSKRMHSQSDDHERRD
jgi:hypothetical protein